MIMWAVECNNIDILKFLLPRASSRDLNVTDNQSKTALHWAAHTGLADYCRLILEADRMLINVPDSDGNTPAHLAASANSIETLQVLSKYSPDLSMRNVDLDSPDNVAKISRSVKMYIQLLRCLTEIEEKRPDTPKRRKIHHDISLGREVLPIPVFNGIDDENFTDPGFVYLNKSRPRDSSLTVKREIEDSTSCICQPNCDCTVGANCDCIISSEKIVYRNGKVNVSEIKSAIIPVIQECNDLCSCSLYKCSNRVVQHGMQYRLEIFRVEQKGWGLRSTQFISKGSFVCEIIGEIVKCDSSIAEMDYIIKLNELGSDQA